MNLTYNISISMLKVTLKAFSNWKVEGKENVPPMGPLIIVPNHQSNIDPPLLAASIRNRRLYYVAKEGIFANGLLKTFLKNYGAFPLKQNGLDVSAFRWLKRKLATDQAVVIFPEGTRQPGSMREAASGVAKLALTSQAPLLPVGITGTEKIGPIWRYVYPTGDIKVRIGQPFTLPPMEGNVQRAQLDSLTNMIMERVAALLPESYRGIYSTGSVESAISHESHSVVTEPGDRNS